MMCADYSETHNTTTTGKKEEERLGSNDQETAKMMANLMQGNHEELSELHQPSMETEPQNQVESMVAEMEFATQEEQPSQGRENTEKAVTSIEELISGDTMGFEVVEKSTVEEMLKSEENTNSQITEMATEMVTENQEESSSSVKIESVPVETQVTDDQNQPEPVIEEVESGTQANQPTEIQAHPESTGQKSYENLLKKNPPGTLIREQLKYCGSILKSIKKHRDVGPFLMPVDPIALGVPDYFDVIKTPMDISTMSKKLEKCEYQTPDEFIADFKQMIKNCFTYNAPETAVYKMGQAVEKQFESLCLKMPTELPSLVDPADYETSGHGKGTPGSTRKRRLTGTDEVFSKRKESVGGKSNATPSRHSRRGSIRSGGAYQEEMKWCMNAWKDLTKKANQSFVWPFMQPVDAVALGIPDYYEVIKHPMDMSLIKKKLDQKQYSTADEFAADIRQIFDNCYTYNAAGTDIVTMCRMFETVFNQKWATKPIFSNNLGADGAELEDAEIEALNERYLELQGQMESIKNEMESVQKKIRNRQQILRNSKKEEFSATPMQQGSKATQGATTPQQQQRKSRGKKEKEIKPMTFDEKRQLSLDINQLAPEKLGRVVEIIHESMPHLKENAEGEEIELDIDSLDAKTLRQLANYVLECNGGKKKTGNVISNSATGGLGDDSSDESESESD